MTNLPLSRFGKTCLELGVPQNVSNILELKLRNLYAEKHRFYHTITHIETLLSLYDSIAPKSDPIMELAIWFHDCIYQARAKDNELQSAKYFESTLGKQISSGAASSIFDLILATRHLEETPTGSKAQLIVDLDLSTLGSTPTEYDAYQAAIRKEYAFASDTEYKKGRTAVLEHFLSQKIFKTSSFDKFEKQARLNIAQELQQLHPSP